MPLNKPLLISSIQKALKKSQSAENLEQSQQILANELANAIELYIKQATVTVSPGQVVATPSGTGATTSPGRGKIS